MLVLSRKADESIWIGNTRVKVLSIHGGRVRLGVEAPGEIPIFRGELVEEQPDDRTTALAGIMAG